MADDHIDCKGWGNADGEHPGGVPLRASRDGSRWKISVNGGPANSVDTLDFLWWDDREHNVDVRAYWNGNDFTIYRSNGVLVGPRHELQYFAPDPNATQRWASHWDPQQGGFIHRGPG
jgi:hypothetical protein